jgi:superfamily I DNA/RNA helicase/RecB family exonuclease
MLVIGGPGTGKTTTLVESVAARVAAGTSPERIGVFTFGRRGATRLRDQIGARLGAGGQTATTTGEPMARTFHGYAFGLLRRAAVRNGEPPPRLLTGPEQDLVIRELLYNAPAGPDGESIWPSSLRGALKTRAFAVELRDLLLRCAERGVGPARLADLAAAHQRPDWAAAARFYTEYLQVLALRDATGRGGVAYDYAELIRVADALLREDDELLAAERRRLTYVYVDELADTDPAQIELLQMIAGDGKHLVGFADPDSAAFSFRGSDPGVIRDFPDTFRGRTGTPAVRVTLGTSYRAGVDLLAATRGVAERLRGPSRHRFAAPCPKPRAGGTLAPVEVTVLPSEVSEAAHVALRLRKARLIDGIPWSRMAVVLRSTLHGLGPVRRALRQAGIPMAARAAQTPLHREPAVRPLLLALRCALDPDRLDEDAAVALLHSPLGGADPLAERQLRHGLRTLALAAGDRRPSGVLLAHALREPDVLRDVGADWAAPALAVAEVLRAARELATDPSVGVENLLWEVWSTSGLAERWAEASVERGRAGEAADRDLDAVLALFDAAASFAARLPGAGPGVFLEHVEGQDLPADSIAPSADRGDGVTVLTAHATKGLEWDLVAVVGVQEGNWPDLRLRGSVLGSATLVDVVAGRDMETVGRLSALLDEERRLFYLAVTRARTALVVTAVAGGDTGSRPSRFLRELAPEPVGTPGADPAFPVDLVALVAELRRVVCDQEQPEHRGLAAAGLLRRLAAAGVAGADPDDWWGLAPLSDARALVEPGEPVTVTPSTVENIQRCGLRWLLERHGGAGPASPEQSIGNLLHAAAVLAGDASVDRAALAAYVAQRFDAIELSARWLVGRERRRVDDMLDKLLAWLAGNPRRLIGIEREFLVRLADPDSPVVIRGRVDRLEVDEAGRLVVVDLKTGRTTPVGSQIAEHAQLAAYQAAVAAGAFRESDVPGGATLVQLGGPTAAAKEQVQPSPLDTPDPGWALDLVRHTAKTMAAATFDAVANAGCRRCVVQTSCPVSGKGKQVVG